MTGLPQLRKPCCAVKKGVSHQRHPLRNIKNNTPITKCNRGMVKCAYEH